MIFPPEPEVKNVPLVTAKEVLDAVRSFPNGSSGGLDGLSPQHLKNLLLGTQDEYKRKLLDSFVQFFDHVLAGNVPTSIRSVFFWSQPRRTAKERWWSASDCYRQHAATTGLQNCQQARNVSDDNETEAPPAGLWSQRWC